MKICQNKILKISPANMVKVLNREGKKGWEAWKEENENVYFKRIICECGTRHNDSMPCWEANFKGFPPRPAAGVGGFNA